MPKNEKKSGKVIKFMLLLNDLNIKNTLVYYCTCIKVIGIISFEENVAFI